VNGDIPVNRLNLFRCRRLVDTIVEGLALDLKGLTVLTEAATGHYALTASIAALAGAEEVLLLSRDSRFGSAAEALDATRTVAGAWGVDDRLRVLRGRDDPELGRADIVTNLGFVRPIDFSLIRFLKQGAVVPLMFESWEYRPEDLDLGVCREAGIAVAGTDESDPRIGIFDYLGPVAVKLLFELDVEVLRASILVIGGDDFAQPVAAALEQMGARVRRFDPLREGALPGSQLKRIDGIVVAEHRFRGAVLGPDGPIPLDQLATNSPGVAVAHIAGGVDAGALRVCGIAVNPPLPSSAGHMSVTTDYVGPRPVIELHAAGLRVGQALAEAVRAGYVGDEAARQAAVDCSLVQPMAMRPAIQPEAL
jgi:hypothetical protein